MLESLPKIAAKHPFPIEVKAGEKYFWCSCGHSEKQPFCDGAHKKFKNEDGTSVMKSVMYQATEDKVVYFCGCKRSKSGLAYDKAHLAL